VTIRNKSKNVSKKIFKIERNGETIFVRDGRQMYFYSSKVKDLNGEITPAKPLTNLWTDIPYNGIGKEGGVRLKNGKKPEKLLKRIIDISTKKNDIVLDFHLGSGTSAAVSHKMNRQYIGIEQLDYPGNDSIIRLKNVINGDSTGISEKVNWKGGGEFIYLELKKFNEAFIEKIEEAKDTKTLFKIWEEMKDRSFLNYNVDLKKQEENIEEFKLLSLKEQKKLLLELLDKNQLYVNLSSMNDKDFKVTEDERKVTKDFYEL